MRRLVLGIALAAVAWAPAVGLADDQRIADFVKSRLQQEQQAGNLRGFNIDMRVERGTIWFKGFVANEQQEMLVLKAGQQAGHLGAVQVVDEVDVQYSGTSMAQSQYSTMNEQGSGTGLMPMPNQTSVMVNYQEPINQQYLPSAQPIQNGPPGGNSYSSAPPQIQSMQTSTPLGTPIGMAQTLAPGMQASAPMPMPMGMTGQDAGMAGGSPNMPGYAWPGYAAHPNYAAVTYPNQYSPSAWPYIGPFYPYPQVPLGWRKVQLEWDDGWWYLDFKDR
jgi:hypothetical protein